MKTLSLFGPQYSVIYADPPWSYSSGGPRGGQFGELDYPTMSTREICNLQVSQIAADDAVLFQWFTGSFMADALQVGEAWGFKFVRIDKVWAKKTTTGKAHAAVGPWGMSDAEFLGLWVRGSGMCGLQAERNQYVITEAEYPGTHSRKPEVFRQQIERRFPDLPRVELFAREAPDKWAVWGNEVQSTAEVPAAMLPNGVNHCPDCKNHFSVRRYLDRIQFCTECSWWAGDSELLPLVRGEKVA